MPNRLALSSSPYLRQHAENPIDWFPWGDEAFEKARNEGKPVLLSVGYSSCHWCHVMAHESFEDAGVAAILNEHFVCIKVDREERPDVDDTYMTAVQLSSGRGGWPMTLFLTPDKKPFFAGTYLPKEDRMGQPGFVTVIRGIAAGWQDSRDEFEEAANEFARALTETIERSLPPAGVLPREEQLVACLNTLAHDFDPHNGGFGGAPKFPPHTAIEFLLALGSSDVLAPAHKERALAMADGTLRAMALGGIRDHVGGGFHRYSTDAHWLLPHFEKMLVDNALMLANYATGFSVLGRPLYKEVADEIVEWLEREMRGPDGLYFSALDADSDGEEGRFYVWAWDEVRGVLGERAVPFMEEYGFARNGNFDDEATGRRTGANIPHLGGERRHESSDGYDKDLLMLREAREKRPRPGLDDKALVGQNGLLIAGFVAAARLDLASQLASQLWEHWDEGHLPRQIVNGGGEGVGFLDDYAGLAYGLTALGRAEPEGEWLSRASLVAEEISSRFVSVDQSLTSTGSGHEVLFGNSRPVFDQPAPSATALACRTFVRTGRELLAESVMLGAAGWMERAPTATEALHLALMELLALGVRVGRVRVRLASASEGLAVVLEIEPGWHLYGPEGSELGASTVVDVSVPATMDYPPGPYVGTVRIPIQVLGGYLGPVEVMVSWQPCSDQVCEAPGSVTFTAQLG